MKTGVVGLAALLALGGCASPYPGMMGMPMEGGEINPFPGDDSSALLAGLDAAEMQANRPGDAALTCNQLGVELTAIALDPQVQRVVQRLGGSPQATMAELRKQQQLQEVTVAAYLAVTVLSQIATRVPGLGMYTSVAQGALGGAINAQQEAMTAQAAAQAAEITPIMPQIMRGNRVEQLSQAKNCQFLKAPA